MTLLEKIKNYKWFDSPNKLRAILEELYNSIGGGSGGGTQDLQSVLDNGSIAEDFTKSKNFIINYTDANDTGDGANFRLSGQIGDETVRFYSQKDLQQGFISIVGGRVSLQQTNSSGSNISLRFPESVISGNILIFLPDKPSGNYTLATLDDIKKINLSDRIYANNAAAISGGLTANDVYRTATGELRIVV